MVAWPAVICPPVGKAPGSRAKAGDMVASNAPKLRAPTVKTGHPFEEAFSETTIHFSLTEDHMMRNTLFISR
jgi:hypothetical protein